MGTRARSKRFVRTEIPATEQRAGWVILLLLAGIAATVFHKGRNYDPDIYALNPEALESTREAVIGKAATLGAEQTGAAPAAPAATAAPTPAGELPVRTPATTAMGPTEHYVEDTLYEKINGRAPAYLEFNFRELTCRTFSIAGNPGQYLDVFLYRMDSPLNAFGIFSLERDPQGGAVDFAADGYRSEMGYFFRRGDTYVQVIASSPEAAVMNAALDFCRALADWLPAGDDGLEARMALPAAGQVPGTLRYIRDNAYGLASLANVFEARYLSGGSELGYFVMASGDSGELAAAWKELRDYFTRYAKIEEEFEIAGRPALVAESFGQYSVACLGDDRLSGVMNADDRAAARAFIEGVAGRGEVPAPGTPPAPAPQEPEENYEPEY